MEDAAWESSLCDWDLVLEADSSQFCAGWPTNTQVSKLLSKLVQNQSLIRYAAF